MATAETPPPEAGPIRPQVVTRLAKLILTHVKDRDVRLASTNETPRVSEGAVASQWPSKVRGTASGDAAPIWEKAMSGAHRVSEFELIGILARLFGAAFRLGHLTFRDAARFVLESIRAALGDDVANAIAIDHLQGAYIGVSGRYRDSGADAPA